MAVPKKKTTPSKQGSRRSHQRLRKINVVVDSKTGEHKLPHHMSLVDGTYNNRQIVIPKTDNDIE